MSFFSKKMKEPKRTQIISKGLALDELIKEDIVKELKDTFSKEGELVTTFIRFHIIPKERPPEVKVKKAKEGEIVIGIKSVDHIALDHPTPDHVKDKVVVITSNRNKILEKFLK